MSCIYQQYVAKNTYILIKKISLQVVETKLQLRLLKQKHPQKVEIREKMIQNVK